MTLFETLVSEAPQSVRDLLEGLKGLRENPEYHPEESTFEHIRIVTERLADTQDADLIVAGFFHDLFKLKTAIVNEKTGHPSSPYHDVEVAKFIREDKEVQGFIVKCGANVEVVAFLCEQHMRVKRLGEMRSSKRWALMSEELFPKLCLFTLADKMHNDWSVCYQKWKVDSEPKFEMAMGDVTFGWLLKEEEKMLEHKKKGFKSEHRLNGKDLIAMGYPQGKVIGMAIKLADEKFKDTPIDTLMDVFSYVLRSPKAYLDDEVMGELAKELVSVDADVV